MLKKVFVYHPPINSSPFLFNCTLYGDGELWALLMPCVGNMVAQVSVGAPVEYPSAGRRQKTMTAVSIFSNATATADEFMAANVSAPFYDLPFSFSTIYSFYALPTHVDLLQVRCSDRSAGEFDRCVLID